MHGPFHVEQVPVPYDKDYDALAGMSPRAWPLRYDLQQWGLLVARRDGVVIGGAAIAPASDVMTDDASSERSAVLWDLRVAPEHRGQRVGTALFRAAEQWAIRRGYRRLLVETQDVNVPACRLYEQMGCRLVAYEEHGYPELPGEARLVWERSLAGDRA